MWPALLNAAMPEQFLTTPREDYLKWTVTGRPAATGIERGLRNSYTKPFYALLGIAGARAGDRRRQPVRAGLRPRRVTAAGAGGSAGARVEPAARDSRARRRGRAARRGRRDRRGRRSPLSRAMRSSSLLVREYTRQHVARHLAGCRGDRRSRSSPASASPWRSRWPRPWARRGTAAWRRADRGRWRDRREPDGSSSARKSPRRS